MENNTINLADYGWSPHFQSQLDLNDLETTTPVRVLAIHRGMIEVIGPAFAGRLQTTMLEALSALATGWVRRRHLVVGRGPPARTEKACRLPNAHHD